MGLVSDKDFIVRLAQSLGTLLSAVMGLRKEGKEPDALELLATSSDDLLGVPRMVLDSLDAASAARMLAEPNRTRIYARLLREKADILRDLEQGDEHVRRRAAEILIEATRMKGGVRPEDRTELAALGEVDLTGAYADAAARLLAPA